MSETSFPQLNLAFFSQSRVKLVRQTEQSECGYACLAMVAGYHGRHIDLVSLRRKFAPSMRGATLKSLMLVADQLGLAPRPVKLEIDNLANLHLPVVLHWDLNHFVVMEKVKDGKALIHDPAQTSKWVAFDDLSKHFTGVALELRPASNFETGDERERLKFYQLWKQMVGLKRAIFQILILSLVLQAFVLASPYYMQIAIDRVVPSDDLDLLAVLAMGFGLFMVINVTTSLLRAFVLLWAGSTLGYGLAVNIARKLFRLPISWFESRHVGDILSRFQSLGPIQQLLLTGAVAAVIDGLMAILTLTAMFFVSPILAAIAVTAFLLYLLVRIITFPLERSATEETIVAGASEQSVMIETLRGMTALRLFNKETHRLAFWQTKLTDSVNASISLSRIGIWQSTANNLIFGIENILTIYFAIRFVIDTDFTVGFVFAYMSYKGQFTAKAISLVDQFIRFRMAGLHLERLSDIALSDEDVSFERNALVKSELKGKIELKNVIYRYSPHDPVILSGVNLEIEPGAHIAITGPSGGGKSTLVKLLLGLVEPDSGEMLVDGLPLSQFGYKAYHEQVAAVLQDDMLFAGSIADNIALFDDEQDMEKVVAAAQMAAIHSDIMAMPMQYETLVGDMGSTLSGGQLQRVLLARALYRQPKILVMDEGTAHLDSDHETAVNFAIKQLGITRIVIAHRQETVLNANEIYTMKSGFLQNTS